MEQRVTAKLLAALKASDLPAEAYVRGLTEATAKKFLRPGLTFYKAPQPIDKVLARATLAIHHGGSGMSLACCSAGRPQLALPIHEETLLTAQALSRIGVGKIGSASCRARVCQYVEISVVAVSFKKKNIQHITRHLTSS